jgi:hypothetical protein
VCQWDSYFLENQLVVLQGEVDRVLGLMDEGLGSFWLKDAKIDKGKAQLVLLTPPADPTPKKIVFSLVKRNKGPLVKLVFRWEPLLKWVQKPSHAPAFSHQALLPVSDLVVDTG